MSETRHPGQVELTLRAVLLGGLITVFFTAANVYLGLKVGLTVDSWPQFDSSHREPTRNSNVELQTVLV